MQFNHITLIDLVIPLDHLSTKFSRAPDLCISKFSKEVLMNREGNIPHRTSLLKHNGFRKIGLLSRSLRIDPDDVEELIDLLFQFFTIHSFFGRDGKDVFETSLKYPVSFHCIADIAFIAEEEGLLGNPSSLQTGNAYDRAQTTGPGLLTDVGDRLEGLVGMLHVDQHEIKSRFDHDHGNGGGSCFADHRSEDEPLIPESILDFFGLHVFLSF